MLYRVAIQYIGVDGLREVQFASEELIEAPNDEAALIEIMRRHQVWRAKPGSLKTLVRLVASE